MFDEDGKRYRAGVSEAYLEPIRLAGKRLRVRQAEMSEERERACGLVGLDYTRPFVVSSAYGDAIPDALARLAEMERDYRVELDALSCARDEARAYLSAMGGRYADLLRLRYVSALPWRTVAEGMGLAVSTCKNMRADALSRFFDYLPHTARPPLSRAIPENPEISTQ